MCPIDVQSALIIIIAHAVQIRENNGKSPPQYTLACTSLRMIHKYGYFRYY